MFFSGLIKKIKTFLMNWEQIRSQTRQQQIHFYLLLLNNTSVFFLLDQSII